jgi:hypothetical protein
VVVLRGVVQGKCALAAIKDQEEGVCLEFLSAFPAKKWIAFSPASSRRTKMHKVLKT